MKNDSDASNANKKKVLNVSKSREHRNSQIGQYINYSTNSDQPATEKEKKVEPSAPV